MERFREFCEALDVNVEHDVINTYQNPLYRVEDVSAQTGVSVGEIYRVLRKYGIPPQRLDRSGQHEQVIQYDGMGLSPKRIAELTGYSGRQVYNIIRGARLERN